MKKYLIILLLFTWAFFQTQLFSYSWELVWDVKCFEINNTNRYPNLSSVIVGKIDLIWDRINNKYTDKDNTYKEKIYNLYIKVLNQYLKKTQYSELQKEVLLRIWDYFVCKKEELIFTNNSFTSEDLVKLIWDDMHLEHEGKPHGVPSYFDFAQGPMIKNVTESGVKNFQAMTWWGQVYEALEGNSSVNTRVEIKNYRAFYLSKLDNKWYKLSVIENITEGAGYPEDYQDDNLHPGGDMVRFESNGHISCKPGSGFNFHFYTPRMSINPSDIAQIATSFDAKLIMANLNGIDDRNIAKFVASCGADVWKNMTVSWASDFSNNNDIWMWRFKYVNNDWQTFTFLTDMSLEKLEQNPPPLVPLP